MQSETDLLILGGSGFIGARTAQAAQVAGLSVACTYRNRPVPDGIPAYKVDAAGHGDPAELAICLSITRPKAVIHCAIAWALDDENEQMRVSASTLRGLIDALTIAGLNSRIVYVSTNAVFSGRGGPYREHDRPDPHDRADHYRFYGLGRRAGEQMALEAWPNSIIARTANVDGRDAWGNLNPRLAGLLEPLRAGLPLPRYVDRTISPTLVDNLAEALVEVANPDYSLPPGRILHLAGRQPMTDFDYARRLAAVAGADPEQVQPDRYLPPGSPDIYNIGLNVEWTQAHLRTQLLDVDGLLTRIFPQTP